MYLDQEGLKNKQFKARVASLVTSHRLKRPEERLILFLGKNFFTTTHRVDIKKVCTPLNATMVFINFTMPGSRKQFVSECMSRVAQRGLHHESLHPGVDKYDRIMKHNFGDKLTYDNTSTSLTVNIQDDRARQIHNMLGYLGMHAEDAVIAQVIQMRALQESCTTLLSDESHVGNYKSATSKSTSQKPTLLLYQAMVQNPQPLTDFLASLALPHHMVDSFALTLAHAPTDPSLKAKVQSMVGQSFSLTLDKLVYDAQGCAFPVRLPSQVPCGNTCPFITAGTMEGVKPFYNHSMLLRGKGQTIALETPIHIVVTVQLRD